MTDFSNKISILRDLWVQYRDDEYFLDLFEVNDLGFPLAFLAYHQYVVLDDKGIELIDDTWGDFLNHIDVIDTGYEDLTDIYFVE